MNKHFAALILTSLSALGHAQGLTWGDVMNVDPMGAGGLRPRIIINGDGQPVVLWAQGSTLAYSAVGTSSAFTAPEQVNPSGVGIATSDWQGPGLAGSGDTVWAVMKGVPEDARPCYLIGSMDGGHTWGDTLRIDADGELTRFPSVAVRNGGEPVLQYMQFDANFSNARYVVRAMADGVLGAPVPVSTPFAPGLVCDCCPGQVVSSNDRIVALYRNAGDNIRTIWGASSTDGGQSFPTGAELDGTHWMVMACPSSGPAGYITTDSVRYVWMSGGVSGGKIYLASAALESLAAVEERLVQPGQAEELLQNYPRIAGNGDTLGIVWEQTYGGETEILFSWSTTGLAGLSTPDTVNVVLSGTQSTPDITFRNGVFHIVWSEYEMEHVAYRTASISGSTGVSDPSSRASMVRYDATTANLLFDGTAQSLVVTDGLGREVVHSTAPKFPYRLRALAPGVHTVRLVDISGRMHVSSVLVP